MEYFVVFFVFVFQQKRLEKQKRNDANIVRKSAYQDIVKANDDFEFYYKTQKIVDSDEEWDEFMSSLRLSLPSSFRISSFCTGQTEKLGHIIQNNFIDEISEKDLKIVDENIDKELVVSRLPWYPKNLAWTFNMSKVEIRKCPALAKLHQFLVSETETVS